MSDRSKRYRRRAAAGPLLGWLLTCLSCRSEAERERSREAETLSSAIRALRDAPHDAKQEPLERLRAISCHHPLACETRAACERAYALHLDAVNTSARLRAEVRERTAPSAEAALEVLAAAEKDLERSRRMMIECLRLETTMLVEARP